MIHYALLVTFYNENIHRNVHIEIKTQFKIIYFITPHCKSVHTHGLECPYGAYIFTPSLFLINPDMCMENCLRILCPFCAYATFINVPLISVGSTGCRPCVKSHWIITINGKMNVWKCKLIFPTDTLQQKIETTDLKPCLADSNTSVLIILATTVV